LAKAAVAISAVATPTFPIPIDRASKANGTADDDCENAASISVQIPVLCNLIRTLPFPDILFFNRAYIIKFQKQAGLALQCAACFICSYQLCNTIVTNNNKSKITRVGLVRRLMAVFYDLFLLIAILFLATVIANSLNRGEAIDPGNPYYPFFVLCLLLISFFYYGWFWTHSGQTLGMQTWKMKLVSDNNQNISWRQAFIRAITALGSWGFLGLGFFWSLFNSKKHTWHDMVSHSELIDLRATEK
jgi:uncharacterized RDD family membrane protein YckC